jgi:hypothetical protein
LELEYWHPPRERLALDADKAAVALAVASALLHVGDEGGVRAKHAPNRS